MYINICKDIIIKSEDIIGIFKLDEKVEKYYEELINKLTEKKNIIDYSDGNIKSLILYIKNGEEYGILSNISTFSLGKKKNIN